MSVDGVIQNASASDAYKILKLFNDQKSAVKALTEISEGILENFESKLEDQNEYIIDLEETTTEASGKVKETDAEIKKIMRKISNMLQKGPYSEMSPEDKEKYSSLTSRLTTLEGNREATISSYSAKISEKNAEIDSVECDRVLDYGNTLVDKATPLAESASDKNSLSYYIARTENGKVTIGKHGVDVGNQMLDAVDESKSLSKEIKKKKSSGI